jgi:hypothetical protein
MRKNLFTMIAGLATAMLLNASGANAAVYKFTFESNDTALTRGRIHGQFRERSDQRVRRNFRADQPDH